MSNFQSMFVSISAASGLALISAFSFCSIGKASGFPDAESYVSKVIVARVSAPRKNDTSKFDEFLNMIDEFFDKESRDIGEISKKFDNLDEIIIHPDYALNKIKSDKYFFKIDDMGSYYAIQFKGQYRSSPIIGFSIEKLAIVTFPYANTKRGD